MTPQELKNSILQLAIQGKLVQQRPEDGTGEELYQQIQAEKQRLIKAGKIKKDKPLPEITEEEEPFEIPESWKWVRLTEVADSCLGKTLNKTADTGELCPYLCSINVYWDGIKLDTIKQACFTEGDKAKYGLEKGDLLVCEGGEAGRCAIWDEDRIMYYQNALHRIRFYGGVSVKYFRNVFELYKSNGVINKHCKGETIKHLVQSELHSILFPLPPLAEQRRIVTKLEELQPYIDRYEQAWNRLEAFNKRFPDDMRKSILQLAIQGKLVEQRPEEGTGEELYQQIQAEKQRLIKAGKIKKDKPLPEITEEEEPFEIPESWKWVRLTEVADSCLGKTLNKTADTGELCPYLCSINVYWDGIKLDTIKQACFTEGDKAKYGLEKGDLLVCEGGEAGRCAIWDEDRIMYYQNALHRIRFYGGVSVKYFRNVFELYKSNGVINKHCKGETIKHLVQSELHSILFPLPPLAEQRRIVAKLEELLLLCERLK